MKQDDFSEAIIQERIFGVQVTDIAARYGLDKSRVSEICTRHKERIEAERAARLAERQERIEQAMNADIEQVVSLLTQSTTLLEAFVTEVHATLQKLKEEERLKPSLLLDGLESASKAFERVRSAVLAQQKQGMADH